MTNMIPATLLYTEYQNLDLTTGTFLHRHKDFWQLQYFTEGKACALLGESSDCAQISIQCGDILIIPPMFYHGIQAADTDVKLICQDFKFRINNEHLQNIMLRIPPKIELTPSLEAIMQLLLQGSGKQDSMNAYLSALLYNIVDSSPLAAEVKRVNKEKASFKAHKYIEQHCCENISAETIANALGYNKSYLCTAFMQDFHITMGNYIIARKIETATQLLIYSDKGMRSIAEETGFKSFTHFFRVFKEHTGYTPKHFRLMNS